MKFKPHTPEWFDALRKTQPYLEQRIRLNLKDAGTADACSLCGSRRAVDYELEDGEIPTPLVTAKFCGGCLALQQSFYEVRYRAMET